MDAKTIKNVETILKTLQKRGTEIIYEYERRELMTGDHEVIVTIVNSAYRHEVNALMYAIEGLMNVQTSQAANLTEGGDWLIY